MECNLRPFLLVMDDHHRALSWGVDASCAVLAHYAGLDMYCAPKYDSDDRNQFILEVYQVPEDLLDETKAQLDQTSDHGLEALVRTLSAAGSFPHEVIVEESARGRRAWLPSDRAPGVRPGNDNVRPMPTLDRSDARPAPTDPQESQAVESDGNEGGDSLSV